MASAFSDNANSAADIQQLCSTRCVSGYKSLQNPSPDETPCKNAMIGQCIVPGAMDQAVYDLFGGSIRWKEGVKTILENFITDGLIDRYGIFDNMFREFKSAPSETGFIIAKVNEQGNDGYNFCDDIVCTYKRQLYTKLRGGYPANESLFHITIHSENPKYIRGNRRSKFACAKYSNNQFSHLMGPFHYKIDENYDHTFFDDNDKPYKKLNPTNDGTFTTPNIQQTFNLDKSPLANQYAIFHEYIYNRFVRYWNRCITNSKYTNAEKQKAKLEVSLALSSSGRQVQQQKQQAEKEANAATKAAKAEALLDDELDNMKEDMINAMIAHNFKSKALLGKTLHAQKEIIRPQVEQYIEQLLAAPAAQPMGSASAASAAASAAQPMGSVLAAASAAQAMDSSFSEAASAAASSRQEIALTRAEAKAAARIELAQRGELQRSEIARLPLEERAATLAAIVKEKIPITREALARADAAAEAAAPFIAENEAAEAKYDSLDTELKRLQREHTDIKTEDQKKKQTEQMRKNAGMRESAIKTAKTDASRAKEELRIKKERNRKPIEAATEEAADAQAIKDDTNKYISAARTAAEALIAFKRAESAVSGVPIKERNQANSISLRVKARTRKQENNEIRERVRARTNQSRSPFTMPSNSHGGRTKKNKKRGRRTKKNKNKKRNTRKR